MHPIWAKTMNCLPNSYIPKEKPRSHKEDGVFYFFGQRRKDI